MRVLYTKPVLKDLSQGSRIAFAYFTNHFFVFKKKDKVSFKEALKFYSSRIGTLLIEMLLMYILVSLCGFNDKIMKIIVQIIIIVLNYVFSKIFVFTNKKIERN